MIYIIFGVYIFFDLIQLIIFIDIILSFLMIFQINFRPKFIASIIDPIYGFIKKHIATTLGVFDFTPLIVIFLLVFLKILLLSFFPEIQTMVQLYSSKM